MTMVEFHPKVQSTQAAVYRQYYINSWNERRVMRLKAIEEEYYSIGNLKSYSRTMYIFCISLHCDVLDRNGLQQLLKIQYQRTGVGLLHSSGYIFMAILWHFLNGRFHKHNICFWKFREKLQSPTRRKIIVNKSNTHQLLTQCLPICLQMRFWAVIRLFLSSQRMA